MRDKIPSFIIKMEVNMKICQYFVEIMICLPFWLKKLNLLKSGLHKDNLIFISLFFLFKIDIRGVLYFELLGMMS